MRTKAKDVLDGISVFVTVARARSFTRAADLLGISPSAVSQAIRQLEGRLGSPLLMRSTRSLELTPMGVELFARSGPALDELSSALNVAMGRADTAGGLLRLTMSRAAYDGVIEPALSSFQRKYREVTVEIEIDGRMVDIVGKGFDAGLRYGEAAAKGLETVMVHPASSRVLVASAGYLLRNGTPKSLDALAAHSNISCRSLATGVVSPWVLSAGLETRRLDVPMRLITSDLATAIDLAVRGHGITPAPVQCVRRFLDDGQLTHVLPAWQSPLEPIYLACPTGHRRTAALTALIDHLVARVARQPDGRLAA